MFKFTALGKAPSISPTVSTEELKLEIAHRADQDIPRFPLEVFPNAIKPYLDFMCQDMGIPVAFTGTAILGALATAIGSSVYVEHKTFKEKMNLYTVLVGETSMGKGESWKYASKPLDKWQKQMRAEADAANQAALEEAKEEKAGGGFGYFKPSQKTIMIKDFNYASLIETIKQNPRGVCGVFDEYGSFFKKAGKRGNEELLDEVTTWWQSFNGHQKNLITRVDIIPGETFCLNLHGGTQPKFIKYWMGDNYDSGFFQRFLFAFHPGFEYADKDLNTDFPEARYAPYEKLIDDIYNNFKMFQHGHQGKKLKLSGKAHVAFELFYQWGKKWRGEEGLEAEQRNTRAGIMGKMLQYVLRFAGILQLCENLTIGFDPLDRVNEENMYKAIKIAKYYMASGEQAVLSVMNNTYVPYDVMYFAMVLKKNHYNLSKVQESIGMHRNTVRKYYNQYKKKYPKLFQNT